MNKQHCPKCNTEFCYGQVYVPNVGYINANCGHCEDAPQLVSGPAPDDYPSVKRGDGSESYPDY